MDRACAQAADDATVTEHDALDCIVVCQHGNDGIAAAGVRQRWRPFAPCATSASTFVRVRL